jgi:hypothetical protein
MSRVTFLCTRWHEKQREKSATSTLQGRYKGCIRLSRVTSRDTHGHGQRQFRHGETLERTLAEKPYSPHGAALRIATMDTTL